MSAYMVSKAHIDALVNVAVFGPKGTSRGQGGWYAVYYGNPSRKADDHVMNQIGDMLVRENLSSIHSRYPDTIEKPEGTPGPIEQYWLNEYEFEYPQRTLTAVEALKAVSCYEYQSCEHPEWKNSDAASFCESLRHNLIGCIPGYSDAAWEIA